MNRDDIIRIAREAANEVGALMPTEWNEPLLERVATIAAAEKEYQIIHILERLQERAGDAHNYYKYAINVIQQEQP